MPQPVTDLGSNLNENLERWANALRGGGDKLAVFQKIYSGKRRQWSAKEIAEALDGQISQKRVTEVGKKLVGDGLLNQVLGVYPVLYEKRPDVHHYKSKILALAKKKSRARSTSNESKPRVRVPIPKEWSAREMTGDEVERGKQIVAEMISRRALQNGIKITKPIEWHYDFDRMSYWMKLQFDGADKLWQLSHEKLTDLVNDPRVRREVERGLAMYVIPSGSAAAPESAPAVAPLSVVPTDAMRDVFISHASEDKDFVGPLVKAITAAGISVWYDEDAMSWGDDLRSSIDRGLSASKFGIVVFSKAFLQKKRWTEFELNGLFAKERNGKKVILPIWHNVTQDDLLAYSPAFADRLAKITSKDSIDDIVDSLRKLLGKK